MIPPPDMTDPFAGVYNTAFPVPDGGVAASFNAFGWFRQIVNTAIPSYVADMNYQANRAPGVFV